MRLSMLDDEHAAFYTVGQVAAMLDVQQAFLRRIDEHRVVSPQRSAGGQRRYSRHDIVRVQRVAVMVSEGMTLPAIRRIIELEHQLAEVTRERDELARQLAELRSGQQGVNQRQAGLTARRPSGPSPATG
ncbi:MAG TPA: MerR family transcriptional regulator [Streptosporangiaceae bacterium]|jgi:DNA-binding transcriptional MerR regulator|nr:MerR family transcriptional regulator [Streptosporangiaceae bacterium]